MFWRIVRLGVILSLVAATAHAEVRVKVATGVPDAEGKVSVDVIFETDGEVVGGFQNDIVFDHTVARLDSAADCRINPAIGTTPFGRGEGITTCADDRTIGPCKTLSPTVLTCADDPPAAGCPAQAPDYSRLRAIVAATEVFNGNSIPEGVAYTCTFTVVNAAALPLRLFNSNVVISDPVGERLTGLAIDGGVCVEENGERRCAPLRDIDQRCVIDFECASGNCDRCCDHQFNGICAAPRTATPTPAATETRTPSPTRTPRPPTPTRTSTSTPLPGPLGWYCEATSQCAEGVCNLADHVCCKSATCPADTACAVLGFAGYCVGLGPRMPGGSGVAKVSVSLRSGGELVGGMQNDIIFDNSIMRIDAADCEIDPAIGLFPLGRDAVTCFDDPTIGPCKNLNKVVHHCTDSGASEACEGDAGFDVSVFRGIVAATAAPNNNSIPDGRLYSCAATVIDPQRLSEVCPVSNVVVSTPSGMRIEGAAVDCNVVLVSVAPGPNGAVCSEPDHCESGNCVNNACCSAPSCAPGESCAVSDTAGVCAVRREQGEGCDFGNDCQSGNCDLQLGSPTSSFRGACGAVRTPGQHPVDCSAGDECDSGNCVDGFCCDVASCPVGEFCNSGRCALPAEPGAHCTADEQCALGLCVDGACCVTGACPAGLSCGVFGYKGVCHEPLHTGSECLFDEQCPTGFCTSGVCCDVESCPPGSVCSRVSDPGKCVDITAEPHKPGTDGELPTPSGGPCVDDGDCATGNCSGGTCGPSRTPTPLAPGGPSGATVSPTLAQPTASPTTDFGFVNDSSCQISARMAGPGMSWPLWLAAIFGLAARLRRRTNHT